MEEVGDASSSTAMIKRKPVVVRVKRRASQDPLDALWLEINERPLKKALLDFASLSIGESTGKALEESRTKKVLVQHVETVRGFEGTKDALLAFLDGMPHSNSNMEFERKLADRRNIFKQDKKQDRLLLEAREKHEYLARRARFTQIWKSRREGMDCDDNSLQEICHFYDIIRVDEEEKPGKLPEPKTVPIDDNAMLYGYLPLLREFLPTAAEEIESDISSVQENYVYDLYAMDDEANQNEQDSFTGYPLVQVDDEDEYYDGPPECEYETDDSNAEDNPLNEYPDEESSQEDNGNKDPLDYYSDTDSQYEKIIDSDEEDEEWKWEYKL
ncbi:putative transcription factor Iwr1 domain-containing protein [Dioscorea sansibarensis]